MPPLPLPSYAIELIRSEAVSIVPNRSMNNETWRPRKVHRAESATTKRTRIASVIRILRIVLKVEYDSATSSTATFPFVGYIRSLVLPEPRAATRHEIRADRM